MKLNLFPPCLIIHKADLGLSPFNGKPRLGYTKGPIVWIREDCKGDAGIGGNGGAGGNGGGAAGLVLLIAPSITYSGTVTGRLVKIDGAGCLEFLRKFSY